MRLDSFESGVAVAMMAMGQKEITVTYGILQRLRQMEITTWIEPHNLGQRFKLANPNEIEGEIIEIAPLQIEGAPRG